MSYRFIAAAFAGALLTAGPGASAQTRVPIEIVHVGEDSGGEQLVYLVRDAFRGSATYEVTPGAPLFRVTVTTIDTSQVTVGPSVTYAVVLTYSQPQAENAFYKDGFITSLVATCPMAQLATCAQELYVQTGAEAELTLKDIADFVSADMQRRAREAMASQQ